MKILILGGNGFIASHLINKLSKENHQLYIYDKHVNTQEKNHSSVKYIYKDFSQIEETISEINDLDIIFHFISTTLPATSNKDPIFDIQSNLVNTVKLLNSIIKKEKIPKIIFLSSGGTVYGNTNIKTPLSEEAQTYPICSYGINKLAIEKYLFMYHKIYEMPYIILRLSNPYGLNQTNIGNHGVITTFINKALNKETIEIWGDGTAIKDYIYIDDVIEVCAKTLYSKSCGVFNIGSGCGHSINQIIDIIRKKSGCELDITYLQRRNYDVQHITLDISLAQKTFNWQPAIEITDGIQIMIEKLLTQKTLSL